MNANPKFLNLAAEVGAAAINPLPNSRKIYVTGSRPDLRVPMREISQSDTHASNGAEKNPPIYVYDCSGPYTDPAAKIDIRSGLPALREIVVGTGTASTSIEAMGAISHELASLAERLELLLAKLGCAGEAAAEPERRTRRDA